jgi:hypothetical protein
MREKAMTHKTVRIALFLLLAVCGAVSCRAAASKSPWGRIVVVGASVSAGFTVSEPLGGPNTPQFHLSRYLDVALAVPHEPVQNLASSIFFMQPRLYGQPQIQQALKAAPTLIVGIDYLFWFCYGAGYTDQQRLELFEYGLKTLEPVTCPLVVGDIPDASAAIGGMLSAEQVPSRAVMAAANKRLKSWAATRPNVVVVPVSAFMRAVMANRPLTVHGRTLPKGKTASLLQDDKLHPSQAGCAFLALTILDALESAQLSHPAADIKWDFEEVARLVMTPKDTRN